MEYKFFYISIAVLWILLLVCSRFRPVKLRLVLVGIAAMAFSTVFDCFFGEYLGYYHYVDKPQSLLYLILSAILLYPEIDLIYLLFLPKKLKTVFIYTAVWLVAMVLFEIASLKAGTVVFTGWRLFPWSIFTYIFVFLFLNVFYRYLENKRL